MAIALTIAYTATPLAAGVKVLVEATPQMSAGISFVSRSKFKYIFASAAAAASPANVLAAYTAKYGALVSGKKIFFRLTPIGSTGIRGDAQVTSIVVT